MTIDTAPVGPPALSVIDCIYPILNIPAAIRNPALPISRMWLIGEANSPVGMTPNMPRLAA